MRWLIRAILTLVVLVAVGFGALLAIPAERIAALATDRLEQATERRVAITGAVRATLFPTLGARIEGIEIGNPDWVEAGPLLTAEALHLGVNWSALLQGAIRLDEALLDTPEIVLVRASDGRASWDFGGGGQAESASETDGGWLSTLGFDEARITDGRLRFLDLATGQDLRAEAMDLRLSLPEADGRGSAEISATVNGAALSADLSVEGMRAFLDGGLRPTVLALSWDGGDLSFDGMIGLAPAAEGQIELEATDLGPVFALLGQSAPDLPEGMGRDRIAIAGAITLSSEGSLHLRDGTITADDNTLTAALDLLPGAERPMIRGVLRGDAIDLSALAGGGGAPSSGGGWSRTPIDASGLFAADTELAVTLGSLDLGLAELSPVDLRATSTNGRMVVDFRQVGAYGGTLSGDLVANGRGGFSTRGDLAFRGVQLQPLLTALADYDRLQGSGDLSLQFLGIGNDLATLMDGLEGSGSVSFGAGAILGFDLAGMIRNFDPSFRGEGQRTVYDSLTASFTISDGVLSNEDLILAAPWGQVTGAGSSDLGAQTLNYRVIPGVMREADGTGGISVPILITGPWADLSFRPDLEFLAEQELAEERERLEAEARARIEAERAELEERLRQEASDALGLEIEEGQGREEIEDALEDRLRQEAEEQLRRLFD